MQKAHVDKLGRIHLEGVLFAIGEVRRMGKSWLAYAYGQPAKTSHHKLRRDGVAWVVSMWHELGKVVEQDG